MASSIVCARRVGLYGRVSTAGHAQDVDLQMEELRQVAAQRGWTIINEYVDEGISGSKESRPGLDQMMEDARAGKLNVVAVWKLDRLGRSLQHLLGLLDELTSINVQFVSLRDTGIDTTSATGRLLFQVLGAFAEFERAMIQERVVAGVRRAQDKGVHCGRPKVDMDLRPALALLEQGRGLKQVSVILGLSRSTLRRRLADAGEWPRTRAASTSA